MRGGLGPCAWMHLLATRGNVGSGGEGCCESPFPGYGRRDKGGGRRKGHLWAKCTWYVKKLATRNFAYFGTHTPFLCCCILFAFCSSTAHWNVTRSPLTVPCYGICCAGIVQSLFLYPESLSLLTTDIHCARAISGIASGAYMWQVHGGSPIGLCSPSRVCACPCVSLLMINDCNWKAGPIRQHGAERGNAHRPRSSIGGPGTHL